MKSQKQIVEISQESTNEGYNIKLINKLTELVINQLENKMEEIVLDFRERMFNKDIWFHKFNREVFSEHLNFLNIQMCSLQLTHETYRNHFQKCQKLIVVMENFHSKITGLTEWVPQEPGYFDENDFDVQCQHCKQGFSNLSQFKKHSIQLDSKFYSCRSCGKQFLIEKNLDAHSEVRHPKIYDCRVCGYLLKSPLDAWIHEQISHSDDQYYKDLRCKYCKKTSLNKKTLRKHIILCHKEEIRKEYDMMGKEQLGIA